MARRLEIIQADETTSALDPSSSRKIEEQFLVLKNDYSLIVVTHILRQAKRLADHRQIRIMNIMGVCDLQTKEVTQMVAG